MLRATPIFYKELIRKDDDRFDCSSGTSEKGTEIARPTNVDDLIKNLHPAERKKVEARAAELMAEEMTLRELRKVRRLTQVRIAKELGITQDSVSRLEKRSDLLLSTLQKTIKAMGGKLSLVAEFPDRPPVVLSGITAVGDSVKSKRPTRLT